jgi:ribosomal protein S18 acetylase RimI-like enzyme
VAAWRTYQGIVPRCVLDSVADEPERARWLRTVLGSDDCTTVIAERDMSQALGFCRYGSDPDDHLRGHIYSLYVRPSASGAGLGTRLLRHVLNELEEQDLQPVTLWVFRENLRARAFYERLGFASDGAERVEDEFRVPEIRLCRAASGLP